MNKWKSTKHRKLTDSEIDLYCQGVEGVLTQIRDRCSQKEHNKAKRVKHLPKKELLASTY